MHPIFTHSLQLLWCLVAVMSLPTVTSYCIVILWNDVYIVIYEPMWDHCTFLLL